MEVGFYQAVLDEPGMSGTVEPGDRAPARRGHQRGLGDTPRLHADTSFVGNSGKTDDTEAVARHDGWVYLFGSHFGSKDGPATA